MFLQQKRFLFLILLVASFAVHGQVQLLPGAPKGGGSFSDCDPEMQVDLFVLPQGNMVQKLIAEVDPANTIPGSYHWAYVDGGSLMEAYGDTVTTTFNVPGETAICLAVFAFDLTTSQPCTTAVCRFIDILPDSSCNQLQADFSIGSLNGNTIVFQDQSPLTSFATSAVWSYGGLENISLYAENTFDGPGPHQVCLTLMGPPPANCTSTVCKWVYLGPGEVDCSILLEPGFIHYEEENFVVVLDTSVTTGQTAATTWEFGDGATAEGRLAIHFYDNPGVYPVCANIEITGPLVSGTCEASACQWIGGAVASVNEYATDHELYIVPNPASVSITLPGVLPAQITILSMDGRVIGNWRTQGMNVIPIDDLPAGTYVIRLWDAEGVRHGRFVKQ